MDTPLTPDKILQVGLGFWASKTLLSAIEMEVFTELSKRPADLATLQGQLGLHARGARDFLDALVALGFLARKDGVYQNTPETAVFLDKNKPSYIGGILEMANHRLYPFWGNLTTALRSGELQNEAKGGGTGLFEALYPSVDTCLSDRQSICNLLGGVTLRKSKLSLQAAMVAHVSLFGKKLLKSRLLRATQHDQRLSSHGGTLTPSRISQNFLGLT